LAPTPVLTPSEAHPLLLELDLGVEALFTHISAGDWQAAANEVERMTAAWYERGLEISLDGAPQASLNALDAALAETAALTAAQDTAGALQAANLASAAVADLYDLYLPPPSADLRRLAMIERQLWLDAGPAGATPEVIAGDFAQLRAIWERIAPQIRAQGGDAFAEQFEASLAAQGQLIEANDAAGLLAEAGRGMELVGQLR
jgi:hypothetical protein